MTLFAIGDIWTNCIDKHCWGHEYAEFPIRHEQDPAMRDANAPLSGFVGAPLLAVLFHPCPMHDANASLSGFVGAPLLAASFSPHAVRDANASLDSSVGAPIVTATFSPHAVRDANGRGDITIN